MSAILLNDKEKHSLAQEKCEENLEKQHSTSTNSKTTSNSIDNNVTTHLCENDKGSTINIISTSETTPLGNFKNRCKKYERLTIYLTNTAYNLPRPVHYNVVELTTCGLIDCGFSLNNVYEHKIHNVRRKYVYQNLNVKSRDFNTYLVKTR